MSQYSYLARRLINIGISRADAFNFARSFKILVKGSGKLWACDYLKKVGDMVISRIASTPSDVVWVKKTRHGFPRILAFLRRYSEEIQIRMSKVARALSVLVPTKTQVEKVVNGATLPAPDDRNLDHVSELTKLGMRGTFRPDTFGVKFRYTEVWDKPSETNGCLRPISSMEVSRDLAIPVVSKLPNVGEVLYPFAWDGVLKSVEPSTEIGTIYASQEPGCKLRMFAAPRLGLQSASSCVHYWARSVLDSLPSDCLLNQEKGAEWAHQKMREGFSVSSIDLSTATCRFPLELQLEVIQRYWKGTPDDLETVLGVVELTARGTWSVDPGLVKHGFPTTLSWVVGQPLGLQYSMSLFSLTHNLLLRGLCFKNGFDPKDSFRVLGDDVVCISELAPFYMEAMECIGVPISYHKCFTGTLYNEFAGYSITPNTLIRAGRWQVATVRNSVGISRSLGTVPSELPEWVSLYCKYLLWKEGYLDVEGEEYLRFLQVSSEEPDFKYPTTWGRKPAFLETLIAFNSGNHTGVIDKYSNLKISCPETPSHLVTVRSAVKRRQTALMTDLYQQFNGLCEGYIGRLDFGNSFTLCKVGWDLKESGFSLDRRSVTILFDGYRAMYEACAVPHALLIDQFESAKCRLDVHFRKQFAEKPTWKKEFFGCRPKAEMLRTARKLGFTGPALAAL